ncbi:unnamed protein product [Pleuronectes platessa]|uniref:Uncharacterized protein n=1 Tax=Pleuronectes platessa TaxID=8262 RepID=A0A9N7VM60_PLEPL|nr:unnamed protein product [Pleuronectes platessa]
MSVTQRKQELSSTSSLWLFNRDRTRLRLTWRGRRGRTEKKRGIITSSSAISILKSAGAGPLPSVHLSLACDRSTSGSSDHWFLQESTETSCSSSRRLGNLPASDGSVSDRGRHEIQDASPASSQDSRGMLSSVNSLSSKGGEVGGAGTGVTSEQDLIRPPRELSGGAPAREAEPSVGASGGRALSGSGRQQVAADEKFSAESDSGDEEEEEEEGGGGTR